MTTIKPAKNPSCCLDSVSFVKINVVHTAGEKKKRDDLYEGHQDITISNFCCHLNKGNNQLVGTTRTKGE